MTPKCSDEIDYVFSLNDLYEHIKKYIRKNGYRPKKLIANTRFVNDIMIEGYMIPGFYNSFNIYETKRIWGLEIEYCDELAIYLK